MGQDGSRRVSMVGCSLQALIESAGPDYELVHVEYENAVLVRQDLSESLRPWLSAYNDAEPNAFPHPLQ